MDASGNESRFSEAGDLEEACITAADGGRDCSCSATNTCRFLRRSIEMDEITVQPPSTLLSLRLQLVFLYFPLSLFLLHHNRTDGCILSEKETDGNRY